MKRVGAVLFIHIFAFLFFSSGPLFASDYDFSDDGEWGDEAEQQPYWVEDAEPFNPFTPNAEIATDAPGAFVDQYGMVRPDTIQQLLDAQADGEDGSLTDIIRPNADTAKIKALKDEYLSKGLYDKYVQDSSSQKLEYNQWQRKQLQDPGIQKQFLEAGAITQYIPKEGEVLLQPLPGMHEKTDYYPLGIYDDKAIKDKTLQYDISKMPEFPGNANVNIDAVKNYTYETRYSVRIKDGGQYELIRPGETADKKNRGTLTGTIVQIAPNLFGTANHVMRFQEHGKQFKVGGENITVDQIAHNPDADVAFFTTKEALQAKQLKAGDVLPVIPLADKLVPDIADPMMFYIRPFKAPGALPEQKVVSKVGSVYSNDSPFFSVQAPNTMGLSGSGVYTQDGSGNILVNGFLSGGGNASVKGRLGVGNEAIFSSVYGLKNTLKKLPDFESNNDEK